MTSREHALAERIDRLEEHAAHQTEVIEELSGQLAAQWKTVDDLTKKQQKLIERLLDLEEQVRDAPPATRPPHS